MFTTASGAGYGLLFLLGLLAPSGRLPIDRLFISVGLGLALALIVLGLLSSTLHLGHPERAWRAFSQWRSSWLSREGVVAVVTFAPAIAFGVVWALFERTGGPTAAAGILSAMGAVATVVCTGMIYASLKPIRQWHNPLVVPVYLLLGLSLGAFWLFAVLAAFGQPIGIAAAIALASTSLAWVLKLLYWRDIGRGQSHSTAQTATGLKGRVRLLDPPHTEENYLMREMGFRVARKHTAKLRRLAVITGWILPTIGVVVAIVLPHWPQFACALAAAALATSGALIERWLFFAEATHTVTLYYGQERA